MSEQGRRKGRRRTWLWISAALLLTLALFIGFVWLAADVGLSEARYAEFEYNLRPALMEHLGRSMTSETTMEFEEPLLLESETHIIVISRTEIQERGRVALLCDKRDQSYEQLILEEY